jgi:hypothetical protein
MMGSIINYAQGQLYFYAIIIYLFIESRDSSVGIEMGYGLDSRGLNSGRGKVFLFSIASRPVLRPTHSPIQLVPGALSTGVKRPESAEVTNT